MGRPPALSHKLDDRATQKLIDHPLVRQHIPSIADVAQKATKVVKRCSSCGRKRRGGAKVVKKTDMNAVREHVANLPQGEKARLLKLINTKELVIPFIRSKDKRRVRLRVN